MHHTLSRTVNEGARNGNLPINKLMKLIYFLLEMSSNVNSISSTLAYQNVEKSTEYISYGILIHARH